MMFFLALKVNTKSDNDVSIHTDEQYRSVNSGAKNMLRAPGGSKFQKAFDWRSEFLSSIKSLWKWSQRYCFPVSLLL